MPETKKPTNLEAFEQFKKEFNLDPMNNDAIMNCLFTLHEELRIHKAESVNGFFDHDKRKVTMDYAIREGAADFYWYLLIETESGERLKFRSEGKIEQVPLN